MRIRTIKPEFWSDEDIQGVCLTARLLAIALLNYADDEGYFPLNERIIGCQFFPLDDSVNVHGALMELSRIDYLRVFSGEDGKRYGFIVNFKKHQVISRPRPSKLKEKCDKQAVLAEFMDDSVNPHGALHEDSIGNGKEGNGKDNPQTPLKGAGSFSLEKTKGVPECLADALDKQRRKRMTAAQKRATKLHFPPDARMQLVGACFGRRPETLWSYYEGERFAEIDPAREECELIARFYAMKAKALEKPDATNYWKSDLDTLLNQWAQQIDRASQMVGPREASSQENKALACPPEPKGWQDKAAHDYPTAKLAEWEWPKLCQKYPDVAQRYIA